MRLLFHGSNAAMLLARVKFLTSPLGYQFGSTTPFSVKLISSRLGGVVWARADRGDHMASRNGRASATPPLPRSSARRLTRGLMAFLLGCGTGRWRSG